MYVSPEWILKQENLDKVLELVKSDRLALIPFIRWSALVSLLARI